jgi:hypothetical protein
MVKELEWNVMSCGYWSFPFVPELSHYKFLESRHEVNICSRWSQNKTDMWQYALFNGVGIETWEKVWGIWNQLITGAPLDFFFDSRCLDLMFSFL